MRLTPGKIVALQVLFGIVGLLFWLTVLGGVGFVAGHFLMKWW